MKQKNDTGVAIKDVISLIGLVAFALLTCLGQLYLNEGEMAPSILWCVVFTVIAAALVFGAAAIKGRKIDAKLLLIIQIVMLVVYLAFAIFSASGVLKFFEIQSEKQRLSQIAQEDLKRIDDLFLNYEQAETEFLAKTNQGLSLAILSKKQRSHEVEQILSVLRVSDKTTLDTLMTNSQKHLLGPDYGKKKEQLTSDLIRPCERAIVSWSYMKVPLLAKDLKRACREVCETVNAYTTQATLPIIEKNDRGVCELREARQTITQSQPVLLFGTEVSKSPSTTVLGIIVLILVHLLILFTYIMKPANVTYRGGGSGTHDGGVEL